MLEAKSDFSVQKHGFQFVNRFEIPSTGPINLPIFGPLEINKIVYGLCGGMCFGALDYYNAGKPVPNYKKVEEVDPGLFTYLWDRQLDSLRLQVVFKVFEWMFREDTDIALRMSRYEIPKLRRSLDRGQPVVLALIRVQQMGDPTRNHQVMATGYELDPDSKQMTISLYDPNHPGKTPTISLNLERPSQGIDIHQSTGEALRGFFLINYKPQESLPTPVRVAERPAAALGLTSRGEEAFRLRWPVDSRRVTQHFGENPQLYKPFKLPGHEGLDLLAMSRANVYAAADGKVYQAGHPSDHPYGLHVRIRHQVGNKVYKTVYAHLDSVFVTVGQNVKAGDLIGLADNTGNSFGAHLHLTLKIDGQSTPGYPGGIVDPWPYLQGSVVPTPTFPLPPTEQPSPPPAFPPGTPPTTPPTETPTMPPPIQPAGPLPPPSDMVVFTSTMQNMQVEPKKDAQRVTFLPTGESLTVLGDADEARAKLGKEGEWLLVQTASGLAGYVSAALVRSLVEALPPSDLVVYPTGLLNLRAGPATAFPMLGMLNETEPLTVLGDSGVARSKLGKSGQWLQVQTGNGQIGYVAAWFVRSTGQPAPASDLVVFPTIDLLEVRAWPKMQSNRLTVVRPEDALVVLGIESSAREKIGLDDQWINVRTPAGFVGFVPAWMVKL